MWAREETESGWVDHDARLFLSDGVVREVGAESPHVASLRLPEDAMRLWYERRFGPVRV